MQINYKLDTISNVAKEILQHATSKIILLYGKMGSGKTTLTKEICKQLGVLDRISSPTFSIVNEYQTETLDLVYHFDCYRIKEEEEMLAIGFDEYIDSGNWCIIEWPENIKNLVTLSAESVTIKIVDQNTRQLNMAAKNSQT